MPSPTIRTARRGRPRKDEEAQLQDAFLDHCLSQFLVKGYRSTTMDDLARGFGASKSTLYAHYGSKAGLVLAAMERAVPMSLGQLSAVNSDLKRLPRSVLHDFGTLLQGNANDQSVRALWSAVIQARADSDRIEPAIAEGLKRTLAPLITYFDRAGKAGILHVSDPDRAALAFAELVSGGLNAFMHSPVAAAERATDLEFALDLFMQGVMPRQPAI
ncbi:TetR/AcrR family transcriptional regulator [Sphingobium sp. HBC34]|uniref:TetR/AcrR family transcriptional regulator n=1 Tax=Sphingobium cyanobacteriorum TaxID=3063954 RepID=A0ABT8ZGL7_9SPHN|nr:TetR/AcrR family transcriptional regulator [Sphingobium sp. HBC34]MDO7833685.1 TetR/AcrR family transcriptional regulator [Sphingobium sp. HBC34]